MCGIVGCLKQGAPLDESVLVSMRDSLVHRGPDDAGLWTSLDGAVALGSRRQSVALAADKMSFVEARKRLASG